MLRDALLFYKNLLTCLDDYGFETNEYDSCVANKKVNGFQMKFVWNLDDLKLSYKDEFEIIRFETYLQDIYGGLQSSQGNIYNYLGMKLD